MAGLAVLIGSVGDGVIRGPVGVTVGAVVVGAGVRDGTAVGASDGTIVVGAGVRDGTADGVSDGTTVGVIVDVAVVGAGVRDGTEVIVFCLIDVAI